MTKQKAEISEEERQRRHREARGKKLSTLHDLIREPITEADYPSIRREFIEGTDRSAALVATAILEGSLLNALAARLIFDPPDEFERLFFGPRAILGTFTARIQIGKALFIYGQQVADMLGIIREIRNVYAHAPKPHPFSHPTIKAELEKLPSSEIFVEWSPILAVADLRVDQMTPARARFLGVCFALVELLNASANLHKGKTLRPDIPSGQKPIERTPLPETFVLRHPVPIRRRD